MRLIANSLILGGIVALHMSVMRSSFLGMSTQLMIYLMSFSKPMSSILSHSSRIKNLTDFIDITCWSMKSLSLPGHAMHMSTPRDILSICSRLLPCPPQHSDTFIFRPKDVINAQLQICSTNSLVGPRTKIYGDLFSLFVIVKSSFLSIYSIAGSS